MASYSCYPYHVNKHERYVYDQGMCVRLAFGPQAGQYVLKDSPTLQNTGCYWHDLRHKAFRATQLSSFGRIH